MSEIRHVPRAPTETRWLPAGAEVDEHRHDEPQLVYASAGVLEVTAADGTWFTPPNRAIWVPAGVVHRWLVHGSSTVHLVGLPGRSPLPGRRPGLLQITPLLRELIMAATDGAGDTAASRRLLGVLRDQLVLAPGPPTMLPRLADDRLRAVAELVERELSQPESLDRLGRRIGCSARTLSRLFRSELGMTFPQWRTQLRLHRAALLLAEGRTVSQVAAACGWSSPSAFITEFRRAFGDTPGALSRRPSNP
ncbi:AraC family transcriptional regulator [Microlunatus parietis]|uniref:HTH-type transcriptional regulator RipA n=1 Tax=Microlunatus parietis TaxID=682979 RepID=A0A7Y9LDB1_9ACTN|nr:helix-turn-helix transcriptional regulator [Microlunatus parietis]NYE72718.1 AraC-like DNA-binding protein [Microlunatus parietis]